MRHPRNDKLQVGDVLDAPPVAALADRYPEICPRPRKVPTARQTLQPASTRHHAGERVYVVGEGDTLFDIARHELGRAARWTEIYDLNRDVLGEDFDYLRPGTELVLPRDRRDPDTVTRKDRSGLSAVSRAPGGANVAQRQMLSHRIPLAPIGRSFDCARLLGGARRSRRSGILLPVHSHWPAQSNRAKKKAARQGSGFHSVC